LRDPRLLQLAPERLNIFHTAQLGESLGAN
jgi:hypothetical protein